MSSGQVADHAKRFCASLAFGLRAFVRGQDLLGWSCWAVAEVLRQKIEDGASDA